MIRLDFLESVEAFKDLNDHQLTAIKDCGQIVEFKRGDIVFSKGEESKFVWILMDGQIDLREDISTKNNDSKDSVSFISKAQTFGWSCFVPPYTYRLSGYCNSRTCRMIKFDKQCLTDLFERDLDIGYCVMFHLVQVVGTHFKNFQDELAKKRGIDIISQW